MADGDISHRLAVAAERLNALLREAGDRGRQPTVVTRTAERHAPHVEVRLRNPDARARGGQTAEAD